MHINFNEKHSIVTANSTKAISITLSKGEVVHITDSVTGKSISVSIEDTHEAFSTTTSDIPILSHN